MMDLITAKRIVRAGVLDFWRNAFVSAASILVMTVTLFTVGAITFTGVILGSALEELRAKADVSIYFTTTMPEERILALKESLQARAEVASVEYISRQEAL